MTNFKFFAIIPAIVGLSYFLAESASLDGLDERSTTTTVLDREERVIRHLSFSKGALSRNIPLDQVPEEMQQIFLVAEDKRFYSHLGIDLLSLVRALWQNISSAEVISGASTVEQQLARMLNHRPRTFLGKLSVLNDAVWLSLLNDKKTIFEAYLNELPFGHNIKGVWEASNYFFGKVPRSLSPSEMAILATLPRSPTKLLKPENKNELLRKKNLVLKNYFEFYPEKAKLREISLKENNAFLFKRSRFNTPHFINYLMSQCDDACKQSRRIQTSLDLHLHEDIQSITNTHVNRLKVKGVGSASVLVIDNLTGEILSYVGSHDFFHEEYGQNDGIQQKRQPGSTLKPFTYAYAFQRDHHPSSILPDIETMFNVGGGVYKPRNYSNEYLGPVRASFALSNSLNIPALYLVDHYGADNILNFYRTFGFDFPKSSEVYGIGITLGNAEVTLYDLVRAYSAFANDGKFLEITPFRSDKKIEHDTDMDKTSSRLIAHILSESYRREHSFGRNSSLDFPFWFASKTGTSTNFRDNWVVGFNERFTVGVWAGNFDQTSMHNVSGVSGAGPIYHDVVKQVYAYFSRNKMKPIEVTEAEVMAICPLSGQRKGPHCPHALHEHFLRGKAPQQDCEVHRQVLVRNCKPGNAMTKVTIEDFSSLYDLWKQDHEVLSIEDQVSLQCSSGFRVVTEKKGKKDPFIEIKSPVDGSLFGLDPNIPMQYQKLSLEVVSEAKISQVRWFLEDKFIGQNSAKEGLLWRMSRGKKSLKAEVMLKNGKTYIRHSSFNVL